MSLNAKPSRARRVLGVLGSVVGVTVTFVTGLAAAAVVHLDTPAFRRTVVTQGNSILKSTLKGDVHVGRIDHIGLDGVSGITVRIKDPDGVQVLDITGAKAKTNVIAIARSALFGKGPIAIPVDLFQVDNVDANLDTDAQQNLRIANAFVPKNPSPPDPNEKPGRGVKVDAPDIRLGHAWVHGYPPGGQPVDADLRNFGAQAHLDTNTRLDAVMTRLALEARALPRGLDPKGNISGKFTMPMVGDKPPMAVQATFEGTVANIPTKVVGSMNGNRIDATVDAHDATGNDTQMVVSEVTIRDALTVHAEAHGDLPHIDGKADIALGDATVDATAAVDTGPTTHIKGAVAVRKVDASKLQKGAPKTDVGLDATGDVSIDEKGVRGTAAVDTLPGMVDDNKLPPVQVRGQFDGAAAKVTAVVKDPSMATKVDVDLKPRTDRADGQIVTAKVTSDIPDIRKVPEIGKQVGGGRVSLDAEAEIKLPEKDIDAKAKVDVAGVKQQQMTIGAATTEATVKGSVDHPVVDAKVHARDINPGSMLIAKLDAGTRIVYNGQTGAITIENPRAEAVRPNAPPITASAKTVSVATGALKVEGAEILGLGDPIHADVTKVGNDIDGKIDAPKIDLKLVARVLGQDQQLGIDSGTLSIGGQGALHGQNVRAGFHAEVKDFSSKNVKSANATVDAAIDGKQVALDLKANVGDAGRLEVVTDKLQIGGPAADPESWKRAHGGVSIDSTIDLRKVSPYLPPGSLPVQDLSGWVVVSGRVERPTENDPPSVKLHAHTKDLVVAGTTTTSTTPTTQTQNDATKTVTKQTDGNVTVQTNPDPDHIGPTVVKGPAPWRLTDVEVGLELENDAPSGLTALSFRVTDSKGILVSLDSKTILPYEELMKNPGAAKDRAMNAPLSALLVIPTRRLQDLPPIVGLKDTAGSISAQLEAGGTVLDPRVRFVAKGRGLRVPSMPHGVHIDSDVALDYDGKAAKLAVKTKDKDKDLLTVSSEVDAVARDFIVGTKDGSDPQWTASAHAQLAAFPLESIPALASQRIKGTVSGDVTLDDLHKDAHVKGHITLANVHVGKVAYEKGNVDVEVGGGKMAAKLRIDQKDGFIDASATSGMAWGAEVAPALSKDAPLEATLQAKDFRAAAIQPFVSATVPTLDGKINANAHVKLAVGGAPQLDGKVVFTEGTVQPAALGEELRHVRATVTLAPDGNIQLSDVYAEGIQGEVRANGNAKIDGTRLANATVNVDIPKMKAFDFALQGQPMGRVSGKIAITASQSEDGKVTKLGVNVPNLAVELPQTTKTGVESLDPHKNVRIGVYRSPQEFVKLPLDKEDTLPPPDQRNDQPSRTEIEVKLGRVEISRENQARVALGGDLKVSIGADTLINGEVHALPGGWADVQGKKFIVEKASVTFDGKPDINPVVLATASWTAQDGTKVYADFIGPVKTGKVVLRSEPARPQNEILAIILFGTPDGANPNPQAAGQNNDGTTKTAVGVGGGVAAQGLTNALDDMTGLQVTARIDSTDSNNPKPEIEFQVSPKVSVSFAHVIGTPPITEPDLNLASLEYRFHRNWSLETTVGDQGKAQLDAIWQKRY